MLQNQAMLMNLSISCWTARKYDRKATTEVDRTHAASGAGRYNKLLIDGDALKPINQAITKLRDTHYTMTLPWGDNGDRLLPSKLYFEYMKRMREAKQAYEQAVNSFIPAYPQLVANAAKRLGTLYDPNDYPPVSRIATKFAVRIDPAPVPDAKNFRVEVGKADADRIKAEIAAAVAEREQQAVKDCWVRIKDVVGRYVERLSDEEGRIYDSMVDNARDLVRILPALNIVNDPLLTEVTEDIERRLLISTVALRVSKRKRQEVAQAAREILAKVPE